LVSFYARLVLVTPTRAFIPDVSPNLANPVWRLTYAGFDKIFVDIDTLLEDFPDRIPIFVTSSPLCACVFMCVYHNTVIPDQNIDHGVALHDYLDYRYCPPLLDILALAQRATSLLEHLICFLYNPSVCVMILSTMLMSAFHIVL
jgi:hypothetical protein